MAVLAIRTRSAKWKNTIFTPFRSRRAETTMKIFFSSREPKIYSRSFRNTFPTPYRASRSVIDTNTKYPNSMLVTNVYRHEMWALLSGHRTYANSVSLSSASGRPARMGCRTSRCFTRWFSLFYFSSYFLLRHIFLLFPLCFSMLSICSIVFCLAFRIFFFNYTRLYRLWFPID